MGTVIGYTRERMKKIEDESIVGGSIVGNNLVLVRHDGTEIDLGSVRGAVGAQGVKGDTGFIPSDLVPIGTVLAYISTTPPSNSWLLCDGASINRITYADLFAIIGTAFNPTAVNPLFNLPDLRGRTIIGLGTGTGLTARNLAGKVGSENQALTEAQLPEHSHPIPSLGIHDYGSDPVQVQSWVLGGTTMNTLLHDTWSNGHQGDPMERAPLVTMPNNTAETGSGAGHNNVQPSLVLSYMIKVLAPSG